MARLYARGGAERVAAEIGLIGVTALRGYGKNGKHCAFSFLASSPPHPFSPVYSQAKLT